MLALRMSPSGVCQAVLGIARGSTVHHISYLPLATVSCGLGRLSFLTSFFFHLFFTLLPCTGCHILSLSMENNSRKKVHFIFEKLFPSLLSFTFSMIVYQEQSSTLLLNPHLCICVERLSLSLSNFMLVILGLL